MRGAKIHTNVRVTGITVDNGRVHEVATDHGVIRTGVVINATGIWAPEVGKLVGVNVPLMSNQRLFLCASSLVLLHQSPAARVSPRAMMAPTGAGRRTR